MKKNLSEACNRCDCSICHWAFNYKDDYVCDHYCEKTCKGVPDPPEARFSTKNCFKPLTDEEMMADAPADLCNL